MSWTPFIQSLSFHTGCIELAFSPRSLALRGSEKKTHSILILMEWSLW